MPITIDLGAASVFAVLAGAAVSNTGLTSIQGSVGVSSSIAVSGFPPATVGGGAVHAGDTVAAQAEAALGSAYTTAAGSSCGTELTGQDLGGLRLTAGSYCFASSAQLTGTLTLDAQGDPNAAFLFQIGSTLITATGAAVDFIGGGQGADLFWQVGSSATLGTATAFEGNILALGSISLDTGATIACGRALAENGAVTLDSNTVTRCESAVSNLAIAEPATATVFAAAASVMLVFSAMKATRRRSRPPVGAATP